MSTEMTPARFIAKWSPVDLPERAASQEHFLDLCHLLAQPTPAEHDATGAEFTFERGVTVTGPASRGSKGKYGYADVWWRGKFAWEYKRKDKYKDLEEAYGQLCQYREALENPPLLIVSDIRRTEIHTNFTGTRKEVHFIELEQIGHPDSLDKLRRVFTDPHSFKPTLSTFHLTENAAAEFAKIADQLRQRRHDPHDAAHFLMKCMFCLFAEDVKLLPEELFSRLLENAKSDAAGLTKRLDGLFAAMKSGGDFGVDNIAFFNGGLFDDAPALPLKTYDIHTMLIAAQFDWGSVEPSIFGTLFERSLDPSKRSQIGAHYTSRDDIMLIVEPVVMEPLRREWVQVTEQVEKQLARRRKARTDGTKRKADQKIGDLLQGFQHRLATLRILDPACGSGNFLYVALQELLALEKELIVFASKPEIGLGLIPKVRPTQLHGIEINPFAAELAQVVIWIGYLQWMKDNGFLPPSDPILAPLQTIECRDAILKWQDEAGRSLAERRPGAKCTGPADWPEGDFIIGNPPFLGSKLFRQYGLEEPYIEAMYGNFELPNTSDLCCYWFELARQAVIRAASVSERSRAGRRKPLPDGRGSDCPSPRAGLLATQGIRGGDNRKVLERIKQAGDIFMAWSDRPWILDGAAVHVSMVGFDDGTQTDRALDGTAVQYVNSDLTATTDTTQAVVLPENEGIAFMGSTKGGSFDIEWSEARKLLPLGNPNGKPNNDVLRPWINGSDITKRSRGMWIVDFGCDTPEHEAALYEAPFEYLRTEVHPVRSQNRRKAYAERWWLHVEPRPAMRGAIQSIERFPATTRVAKHRIFAWFRPPVLADSATFVFARSDDYFFGVLHSSIHELWARRTGTQLREVESGFRYTPTTCFETFPLPWPPGSEPRPSGSGPPNSDSNRPVAGAPGSDLCQHIDEAAKELNEQRERWLNPPEWISTVAQYVDNKHDFSDVPVEARDLIRQSAIMAEAARDPRLKKRTLTNLYNQRPTWLRIAHERLDRAVLAAYAAVDSEGEWSENWAEVWVETGAGQPLPDDHTLSDRRKEIDQQVLANLLRLNLARSAGRDSK